MEHNNEEVHYLLPLTDLPSRYQDCYFGSYQDCYDLLKTAASNLNRTPRELLNNKYFEILTYKEIKKLYLSKDAEDLHYFLKLLFASVKEGVPLGEVQLEQIELLINKHL